MMASVFAGLLSCLVIASWIYWLSAWWSVGRFFRARRRAGGTFTPPVSILKPVKGLDPHAARNFASFCDQDYPTFELLFGVADPTDPAVPVIQRLQREFPGRPIRLIIARGGGLNPKAAILEHLVDQARYPVLAISDSDIRVTPDYLRRVVAPLEDEQTGLVTCLYRAEAPLGLASRLEALHMDVTFLPSAIVAHQLMGTRFAMGAAMVLRRGDLERLGGYAAIGNYLADDYQVGARMGRLGLKIHLSDYVVASVLGAGTFGALWDREVRWARGIRASRPRAYPGLVLTFSTPLALLLASLSGAGPLAGGALGGSLLLRWLVGWRVMRSLGQGPVWRNLAWLPVHDVLSAVVWCAGVAGRRVVWRGTQFTLLSDGRLGPAPSMSQGILGASVRTLDALLRRRYRIAEFSDDNQCILRIAIRPAAHEIVLCDGTRVRRGDPIGELHFWNEQLPRIPEAGPDISWAIAMWRQVHRSLATLAAQVESEPRWAGITAFWAETAMCSGKAWGRFARVIESLGFQVVACDRSAGLGRRLADFGSSLYLWSLARTFNPGAVKGKGPVKPQWRHLWMSRAMLLRQYGTAPAPHHPPGPAIRSAGDHRDEHPAPNRMTQPGHHRAPGADVREVEPSRR